MLRRTIPAVAATLSLLGLLGGCKSDEPSAQGSCEADRDCTADESCVQGRCVTACEACGAKSCGDEVDACRALDLCGDGLDCLGKCQAKGGGAECYGECIPADKAKADRQAFVTTMLCSSAKCTDECGFNATTCDADKDCASGETCLDGSCLGCSDCSKTACADEIDACLSASSCDRLRTCVGKCKDLSCVNGCVEDEPNGKKSLNKWLDCTASECTASCGSSNILTDAAAAASGATGAGGAPAETGGEPAEIGGASQSGSDGGTGGKKAGGSTGGSPATGGISGTADGGNPATGGAGGTGGTGGAATGGAATGGAATGGAATGGSPPVTLEEAAQAMAEVHCTTLNDCEPEMVAWEFGTLDGCIASAEQSYVWQASMPNTGTSVAHFEACMAAMAALPCADRLAKGTVLEECVARGTRENGMACLTGSQCVSGFCDTPDYACGLCADLPPEGAACSTQQECAPGQVCAGGTSCSVPQQSLGTCEDHAACDYGLDCVNGLCRTEADAIGDACNPEVGNPWCEWGMICDSSANLCREMRVAQPGKNCGWSNNVYTGCAYQIHCPSSGKCPARPTPGSTCNDEDGPYCVWPDQCMGGECVAPPSFPMACGS